jgi:A/G-specific adenine glycosylase
LQVPGPERTPEREAALPRKEIQTRLLRWFAENGRDLPWRRTRDPYAIWVSEIMLQQTQVNTVLPYYRKFLKTFPTVRHLARANLSTVLRAWEGLGYYSRARNLHEASRLVVKTFGGKIPKNLRDLLSLPGIGRSTGGAILSFAYDMEAPILDGNAKRVLSRLFAVPGNAGKLEKRLWHASESLIPEGRSNPFNQALMDLGSMLCTPKRPRCLSCPLRNLCKGYLSGKPESYPVRTAKKSIPHISALSAVIFRGGKVLLRQRPENGLLGGLWEFPNWRIEEKGRLRFGLRLRNHIKREMRMNVEVGGPIGVFKQTFSHFNLTLRVFRCQLLNPNKGKEGKWISLRDLPLFPMSRIHRKIANTFEPDG